MRGDYMPKLYEIWNSFFANINEIEKLVEPVAKRSFLTPKSALILIIIVDYQNTTISLDENSIKELCQKGLVEYTEKGIKPTSKGSILSKSLSSALKKL